MVTNFESFVSDNWVNNGVIFILGKKDDFGNRKLYASHIKYVLPQSRQKVNGDKGKTNHAVFLYDIFYAIREVDGVLVPFRISLDKPYEALGIVNHVLGINKNKTPFWFKTMSKTNIDAVIKLLRYDIKSIPNLLL